MNLYSTARWLIISLLVVSIWSAIYEPSVWGWVIAILAIALFIVEMLRNRSYKANNFSTNYKIKSQKKKK